MSIRERIKATRRERAVVLVCGGRDFDDYALVQSVLDDMHYHSDRPVTLIVHGDARGADRLGGQWAKDNDVPCTACPADWTKGRGAGFARNEAMLREHKPDVVIAFPGGNGTAHMVRIAQAAGVYVRQIERMPTRHERLWSKPHDNHDPLCECPDCIIPF